MFPHPYKECFVTLSNQCGILQSTPIGSPVSSLAHHPVSVYDTIWNSPNPLLILSTLGLSHIDCDETNLSIWNSSKWMVLSLSDVIVVEELLPISLILGSGLSMELRTQVYYNLWYYSSLTRCNWKFVENYGIIDFSLIVEHKKKDFQSNETNIEHPSNKNLA